MKLILCGACGRMGKTVAAMAERMGENVVCGVDISPAPAAFPVYPDLSRVCEQADALVDFSSPRGTEERLAFCQARGLPAVLGATGYSEEELRAVERAAEHMPIFRSENFSIGINLMRLLVKKAAQALGDAFDAEIVERHHALKKDAPSGTALMLAESVNEGYGGTKRNVCGREGRTDARDKREIGIHAVRGGNIVGEHEVMFAGEDEILTFSHSARSRDIFARGALIAAKWLLGRPAGLYGMDDLLADAK